MGKDASLVDKYVAEEGRIVLTGVQALVRMPLVRARLDRAAGRRSAGFISGYRGSPLGTYDTQLDAVSELLRAHDVVVRPAVNEDLGATAVWGTQQVNLYPGARFDGVFGIWYGKAPGVDRSGDVFKHANFAGTWGAGGVLAIAGDDHGAKSSSLAAQSEFAFLDAEIPVVAPASVGEVLDFGVRAFDLSRYAGLWVGMTTVADVMDSSASVDLTSGFAAPVTPGDFRLPPDGLGIRLPDTPLAQERRHRQLRLPAAQAFVRENGFDRTIFAPRNARFGVVAAGKAFVNLMQGLADLGIDAACAERLGLAVYKPGLVWPLEPTRALRFARGLQHVLVIEERRSLVETQLKELCYGLPGTARPTIVGKRDGEGRPLIAETGELGAAGIALALLAWLPADLHTEAMRCERARLSALTPAPAPLHERQPFFCSGCPHNSSTVVPAGSRATAGIGCHYLVQTMPRDTTSFTQMGGEGIAWVGQAPFTETAHVFANLGDGTYFHSGVLAIRQAVAAKVNITYKILFNDAVAMTGGQPVDGELTVPRLAAQLLAEGVAQVVVVSDDPRRVARQGGLPPGVAVRARTRLDETQRTLRDVRGVSVLVYDQTCATELRRRRKRGLAPDPQIRVLINERVCEGCGDCSAKSNCVSVEPVETVFGRKRRVDLSSCNQDLSCVDGFCPSFVTIEAGAHAPTTPVDPATPPEPTPPRPGAEPVNIVLAGIGGQGVTSLAAILGMAAHLDGAAMKSVDMLGMAQKGGGVFVHLRIAATPDAIAEPRIGAGRADLLIANDQVVAHGSSVLDLLHRERTAVVLNTHLTPTAAFAMDNRVTYDEAAMIGRIAAAARSIVATPAARLAVDALGDSLFSNMILLGLAWQSGLVPLTRTAIERSIRLNHAAVAANLRAFSLGRAAAAGPNPAVRTAQPPQDFETVFAALSDDLKRYQDAVYAQRFEAAVTAVATVERVLRPSSTELALAAARSLHRLMAYKDEYEVARLYADPVFARELRSAGGRTGNLKLRLAPPLLGGKGPDGRPRKFAFGRWMLALMPVLARGRVLRGSALDPFGWTQERRLERRLRDDFLQALAELCARAPGADWDLCLALARAPLEVRGFGPIKAAAAASYEATFAELRATLRRGERSTRQREPVA